MDPIVLKTFLVPNYTKLMPENMVPGQKVKKVIFTGFSPPPIICFLSKYQTGSHQTVSQVLRFYSGRRWEFYVKKLLIK